MLLALSMRAYVVVCCFECVFLTMSLHGSACVGVCRCVEVCVGVCRRV